MQPYIRTRKAQEGRSKWIGIGLTGILHAVLIVFCAGTGLKYLDPPPPETTFLLDFTEEITEQEVPDPARIGREPQAEEADPEQPVELVKKAESPYVNDRPNTTPASKPDAHGDVEVPVPEKQEIDKRALFPGMSNQESSATTPHAASEASGEFKAGQPDGNTKEARRPACPTPISRAGMSWDRSPDSRTAPRRKGPSS